MAAMASYEGRCHCGNVSLVFRTETAADEVRVRECACGFCRKHGVRSIADAASEVAVRVESPGEFLRYRFGLETADFVVCRRCGVYVLAILSRGDGRFASINLNVLDRNRSFTRRPLTISYEGETAEQRIARRRAKWTPVTELAGFASSESKDER